MRNDIRQYNEEGKAHGYWEVYWATGKLWFKGNYHNRNRHGYWEEYHPNGKLHYKGNYDNGNRIGLWERYYSNGELRQQIFYS